VGHSDPISTLYTTPTLEKNYFWFSKGTPSIVSVDSPQIFIMSHRLRNS
jgi:hypothetical protein